VSERTGLMILRKKIQSIKAEASQSEFETISFLKCNII